MIEWDETKRQGNLKKHALDFVDAEVVLDSDLVVSMPDDRHSDNRWISFGLLEEVIVQVVYAQPSEEVIRIVSMRKATKAECKAFKTSWRLLG